MEEKEKQNKLHQQLKALQQDWNLCLQSNPRTQSRHSSSKDMTKALQLLHVSQKYKGQGHASHNLDPLNHFIKHLVYNMSKQIHSRLVLPRHKCQQLQSNSQHKD